MCASRPLFLELCYIGSVIISCINMKLMQIFKIFKKLTMNTEFHKDVTDFHSDEYLVNLLKKMSLQFFNPEIKDSDDYLFYKYTVIKLSVSFPP